jgi:hypothetical protein
MQEMTETIQKPEKKAKKYRPPWEKEGSYKYLQRIFRRIEDKIDDLNRKQTYIIQGLELAEMLPFDRPFLQKFVCTGDIDEAVLETLYEVGEDGLLPKDVASALNKTFHTRRYQPWHIRYILRRMNRRLETHFRKHVAEKRGMRWALTSFARKAWGKTKEELEASVLEGH